MKASPLLVTAAAPIPAPSGAPIAAPRLGTPAGLARAAGRVEAYCRERVADCEVRPVLHVDRSRVDLRVGPAGGPDADQLWVRDLDPAALEGADAADRLARLIRVWLEPPAG